MTAAPDVLDRLTPVGKPPKSAIVVRADEAAARQSGKAIPANAPSPLA